MHSPLKLDFRLYMKEEGLLLVVVLSLDPQTVPNQHLLVFFQPWAPTPTRATPLSECLLLHSWRLGRLRPYHDLVKIQLEFKQWSGSRARQLSGPTWRLPLWSTPTWRPPRWWAPTGRLPPLSSPCHSPPHLSPTLGSSEMDQWGLPIHRGWTPQHLPRYSILWRVTKSVNASFRKCFFLDDQFKLEFHNIVKFVLSYLFAFH